MAYQATTIIDFRPYTVYELLVLGTYPDGPPKRHRSCTREQDGPGVADKTHLPDRGTNMTAQHADTEPAPRDKLYEIIRRDTPFKQKANEVLELGKQHFGVENGHLTQIDQEADHWEVIASTDTTDDKFSPGLILDLETTYCRLTLETDTPVSFSNAVDQGWDDDPAFKEHGLSCYHGTRLVVDHEPYGTLCFVSQESQEPFGDDDLLLIDLMARLLERELERDQHEAALTRQTNLSNVLNRVLRHNLRNDMSVIRGYTQLMSDELSGSAYADISLTTIDKLLTLSEKARDLERFVTGDFDRANTAVAPLIREVVTTLDNEFPNATVSLESAGEEATAELFSHFSRAIYELLHNAIRYGGDPPTVTIHVQTVPQGIEIEINDNGPGIGSVEAEVLERGTETPLIHGNGLGLWIAHWIISSHGGSIEAASATSGTTMTVTVPRVSPTKVSNELTKLTQARDQYQAAFEKAREAMIIVNDDARIIDANKKAGELYGMGTPEILGQSLGRFLPDDFDFEAFWEKSHEEGADRDTMTVSAADGVRRTVEYSAANKIVPGQTLIISRDITDRTDDQQRLQTTRHLLETVIGASPAPTFVLDTDGTISLWNDAAETLFGHRTTDAVGQHIASLGMGSDETATTLQKRANEPTASTPGAGIELAVQNENDDITMVSLLTAPLTDTSGAPSGLVGVATAPGGSSKQQFGDLQPQLEPHHESLLNTAVTPAFVADATTGRLRGLNTACEKVIGNAATGLLGSHHTRLYPSEDTALYQEAISQAQKHGGRITTLPDGSQPTVVTDAGDPVPVELSVGTVTLSTGPVLFVTFREATTEPRETQLSGVIDTLSHDSRNQFNLAQGQLRDLEETQRKAIGNIEAAHDRLETLITDVSMVAGDGPRENDLTCELAEAVRSTWESLETADATLTLETTQTLRAVDTRLRQLLKELLQNALDHGGPDVTVTVGDLDHGFYIADDGPGIPTADRDRSFEAGYSTHAERTGLGLTIVKEIAREHGWGVTVRDSAAGGARFELIVPPRQHIQQAS